MYASRSRLASLWVAEESVGSQRTLFEVIVIPKLKLPIRDCRKESFARSLSGTKPFPALTNRVSLRFSQTCNMQLRHWLCRLLFHSLSARLHAFPRLVLFFTAGNQRKLLLGHK